MLSARVRAREPRPPVAGVFVVAWSGMRGIVSLASALALPNATASGAPFPGRSDILFVTFCVIFVTLVLQGLSLIPLLHWLRIDDDDLPKREIEVRVAALRAGIARLRQLEPDFASKEEWEVEGRLLGEYEYRIAHLTGHLDGSIDEADVAFDHRLQEEALEAERREITRLRDSGDIPDEIYRKVQYDLDLANERIS
jgi:CPA1 family monovalent cation:H+ antiporter